MTRRNFSKTYKEIGGIVGVTILMYLTSNYSDMLLLEVLNLEKPTTAVLFLNRLMLWSVLLFFFLYVKLYLKEDFLPWKERKQSIISAIISVVILLAILFMTFLGLILLIQYFEFPTQGERIAEKSLLYQNLFLLVFYAFTAGVLEELLFRGYILPTLSKITRSMVVGISLSSIIFGLMHFSYGTFHQVIIPIFFGVIFSTYYAKFRSLKVVIFCHFIWNLVVFLDSADLL